MIKKIALALSFCTFASAGSVYAQTTASQKFKVVVPTSISITAPDEVELTHDETDGNQAFPQQLWIVKGNTLTGVTVSFTTQSAFTNVTDPTFKRNALIALSVGSSLGPATWSVTQASDQTNYALNDENAVVQASSNGVGRAVFNLAVTFITDTYGTFAEGDYETTVVGTVTAN